MTASFGVHIANPSKTFSQTVGVQLRVPSLGVDKQVGVLLQPGEERDVFFDDVSLHNAADKLWWPWQMGSPTLHNATIAVLGVDADTVEAPLGLREISSEIDKNG